jgi:hypothetical protein
MELLGALTDTIDSCLANNKDRTDLGEMAQMAAAESIAQGVGLKTKSLFGTTPETVRQALAELGTVKQFGAFARQFFARFTFRCLDYYLSRALANHTGQDLRFTTLAEQSAFTAALETHCEEAAVIVERFSGEFFSKHNYIDGEVSRDAAARFTAHAMTKLVDELKRGAGDGH